MNAQELSLLEYTAQSQTIKHQTTGFKSLVETPTEWIGSTITLNRLIGRMIYDNPIHADNWF
jgi:hypothetical protein